MAQGPYHIVIIGSGPAGLGAAVRAAELKLSHVLLEAQAHISHTIYRYQKGKHVMAHPELIGSEPYPLRSSAPFVAGKREAVLSAWDGIVAKAGVNVQYGAAVTGVKGSKGAFEVSLSNGQTLSAAHVVLGIGLQGNPRRLGCEGEDSSLVQYQLTDPDEYSGEHIVVVGAGDAAIENAVALCEKNKVTLINRREEFDRAKSGNIAAIKKAQDEGRITIVGGASSKQVQTHSASSGTLVLEGKAGRMELPVNRIIARLGALPPRDLVEKSCGVLFSSKDASALPVLNPQYESNVPGLYVVGALAGCPLIKQALNQGHEVVEFIEGRRPDPVDTPFLAQKFARIPSHSEVNGTIARIQATIPLFAPLTALPLRELLLESNLLTPAANSVVFRRNDYTDTFFSILAGGVHIVLDDEKPDAVIPLQAGDFFGEMSLISGRRRTATVIATAGCVLIETPRKAMTKLLASSPDVKRVLDETFLARAIAQQIAPGAPREVLAEAAKGAETRSYKAGEVLFSEGDAADGLYLIRKGSVTISRSGAGRETVLAYVPAGQYVGEMALLTQTPRMATVKAAIATDAIRLDATAFKALMEQRPALKERVQAVMKSRMTTNAAATIAAASQKVSGTVDTVNFLLSKGLGEATDVLLIDEKLCVGCNQCEKACADTHGGVSRLNRAAGPSFDRLHIPTSCRHCEHPHCMKDCPPDAIKRNANGEVFITDACIGCGNCESNCPYGVIHMAVTSSSKPSLWKWLMFGGKEPGNSKVEYGKDAIKKAVKCDMCKDVKGGAACVRACPTGAALRVSPEKYVRITQGLG